MRRCLALALLYGALLPCAARAQTERNWGAIFRVTPSLGYSPKFRQQGDVEIVTSSGAALHAYELEFATGIPVGLNLEMRFWNRFAVVAGGTWSARGEGTISDLDDDITYRAAGSDFLMAKLGLAVRLREDVPDIQYRQLNGSLFVAPAIIRDSGKDVPFAPVAVTTTAQHFGVNFGVDAELPLASRHIAFTAGIEDWLIFWNSDDYLPRVAAYLEQKPAPQTVSGIDAGKSHMLVVRAGLTFSF